MINLNRVITVVLYSRYHLFHSLETWVDLVWFPVVEVLVFGLLTRLIADPTITQLILLGLINWEVIRVVQYAISLGVMWDVWSRNFSSLFVTPLSLQEFMVGHAIFGAVKAAGVFLLLGAMTWWLYGFNVLATGPATLLYFMLLVLFAVSAGLFVVSLVLRFGTDIQSLSWSLIFLFQPISAVVYPVSVLPSQVRWLAYLSPVTYTMEAIRYQLANEAIYWQYLGYSLLGNLIYLLASIWFLNHIRTWAQKSGAFARMEV